MGGVEYHRSLGRTVALHEDWCDEPCYLPAGGRRDYEPNDFFGGSLNVIGDVEGKECILFDDMVDTAGSLCNAAKAVVEVGGAKKVYACASHGVLSGPALERLEASCIEELALLDTIPAPVGEAELAKARIKYLTVAPMFAEAIERTYQEISIAKLFN